MPASFRRSAQLVACLAACLWAALLLGAPYLSQAGSRTAGARLAAAGYLAGSFVCHQRAERSFHLAGAQLPVCGRCTGLYVSGAVGLLFSHVAYRRRHGRRDGTTGRRISWRVVIVAASIPLVASVVLEALGLWRGTNAWRAVSAVPAGWVVGTMIVESLSFQGRL